MTPEQGSGSARCQTSDQLKIGQLNIQSLKPKLPEIRNDLQAVQADLNIFVLCETWFKSSIPDRMLTVRVTDCFDLTDHILRDNPKDKAALLFSYPNVSAARSYRPLRLAYQIPIWKSCGF